MNAEPPSAASAPVTHAAARTPEEERRIARIVAAGTPLLRTLGHSWRMHVVGYEPIRALREAGRPVILSCWHGQLLPLLWLHRYQGIRVLVSEHRDGEIVARVAERVGFGTVRGSTTRGGGRALLALVRALQDGADIAITPDGPRGPAHRYAPGALVAAQRANAPIVPIAISVRRAWRLRSWDRFTVPKPFARITVAYGPPTWVEAATARDAAAEAARFDALHEAAVRRADEAAG